MSYRQVRWLVAAFVLAASPAAFSASPPQDDKRAALAALDWKQGPATGAVGDKASVAIPKDSALLPEKDGAKFLELTGNLPAPGHTILVGDRWWAVFTFDPVGYVKDDEKIDADALLKQLKELDGPANEERRKRGLSEIYTDGWYVPPHYDPATRHLEWGLRLHSSSSSAPSINYTVRLLGRTGYESATLVSRPETLDGDVQAFKAVLRGFEFNSGERYSEFKQGDRVAEFGLAALVVGGAAAVAAKSGLWKVVLGFLAASWKLVAAAAVAVFAGIGKLFGRKTPQ